MRRAPYARCVFLDTDTTIVGDLTPLFAILTRYDVCGVQLAEGQDYVMDGGIPHAFPEMNGGMLGFRAGPPTEEFFTLWARYYEEFRALNRDGLYHYANVGDQKSLRAALWHSSVRHACVGGEFNFIPFRADLVSLPVAVVHTRAKIDLAPLVIRLNARLGRRAYIPVLDAIVSNDPPAPELRRLTAASLRQWLRHTLRSFIPRGLRDALRRSTRMRAWFLGNRYESPSHGSETKWEQPADKS
jgi:hypothetical protein